MSKKILSLLLVALLLTFFAACGDKNSTTSTDPGSASSAASSASSTASNTSSEASSDTSSAALKGIVDGVYYGNGYSIKVPHGYTLQNESEYMSVFVSKGPESLSIVCTPNPTGQTSVTEKDIEDIFTAQFAGSTIQDIKTVKIDGKDAYTCLLIVDVSSVKVYTYSALIPTRDKFFVAAMGFASQDNANIFQETIESIKLN